MEAKSFFGRRRGEERRRPERQEKKGDPLFQESGGWVRKKKKRNIRNLWKGRRRATFFIFGRERERLNLFPLPPSDSRDGARK